MAGDALIQSAPDALHQSAFALIEQGGEPVAFTRQSALREFHAADSVVKGGQFVGVWSR